MKQYTTDTYKPEIRKQGDKFSVNGEVYVVGNDGYTLIDKNGMYCLTESLKPLENQSLGKFAASGIIPQWVADDTKTRQWE